MDAPSFRHISCRMDGTVLVVTLLDAQIQGDEGVEELRRELLEASTLFPTKKWVVDFKNVQFFSSAGIRPLLTLHRKIQGSVGRMVFCNLNKDLLDVFLVTRLLSPGRSTNTPFELAQDLNDGLVKLRHHTRKLEQDVLLFTFTEENLHGDDLADELTSELELALQETQASKVVLDFKHVKAITTPCLRPMLTLRSKLKPSGGSVVLAGLSPLIEEVLTVTRLIAPNPRTPGLFISYPDADNAVQALSKQS